jgi:hypothetical protein
MRRGSRPSLLLVAFGLSLFGGPANADGLVVFCYNWGCLNRQPVSFSEPWLRKALQPLRQAKNPESERTAAAEVVHRFYRKAAEQTPIGADAPGNDEDPSVDGRMDCIDHSATTKNILAYLQHRNLLRWHEVGPYAHRTLLVGSHYSATLVETNAADDDSGVFVIDPWDVDPLTLPQLAPVREWAGPRFYSLETQHHTQNPPAALTR